MHRAAVTAGLSAGVTGSCVGGLSPSPHGTDGPFCAGRAHWPAARAKGYEHEIECPWESTESLFFGVSQLWIQPRLGHIQSLPWLREVSLSHPCPVSKKTPLVFNKTILRTVYG